MCKNKNREHSKENRYQDQSLKNFSELISNINLLRNKEHGCPWHNIQNHKTLIPYLIEESYEFINSIKNNNEENMREELGDLLLQIMLHTEIEREKNSFSIESVIEDLNKKIKLRHPYIFKKRNKVSIDEAQKIWKDIKNKNQANNINKSKSSNLNFDYLSPIVETQQINFQVEKYGFKWNDNKEILEKLYEEIEELQIAIKNNDNENIKEEFGDILFTIISLSVHLKIDPNKSLRSANQKFNKRFSIVENFLGGRISNQSTKKFRELWILAKKELQRQNKNQNEK